MEQSDRKRAEYYELISGQKWGDPDNYDLCINSAAGKEKVADLIVNFVRSQK